MDKKEVIGLVRRYAKEASGFLAFEKVYLYGSYAAGTAGRYSDIDVAFVVKSCDNYYDLLVKLNKTADKYSDAIEPVIIFSEGDRSGFSETVFRTGLLVA